MERLSLGGAASAAAPRRAAALAVALVGAAAVAWIVFGRWMGGMPGVGADLGAATFAGSWALMMAAMMLPSMTPVVTLYDRMRPPPTPLIEPSARPPTIAVVVPTYGRVPLLERCLHGIDRQKLAPSEVIVAHRWQGLDRPGPLAG